VSTNIAFYLLESDPFQVLLSKNQFPVSREFPGNRICIPAFPGNIICIPAFPGMTKWLSRGNTRWGCTPSNSTQRSCYLGGHPSKYYSGTTLLDFGDQIGIGMGYPTIRPLLFRPRSFRAGLFVPWSFRPQSSRPLVISSPLVTSSTSIPHV
jgi:hypothetical protein